MESIRFSDTVVAITPYAAITGSSGDDIMGGTPGEDEMYGLAGNDTMRGFDSNDYMDGGTGNDQMEGGNGNDTFIVDSLADTILELGGEGTADTVLAKVNSYTLPANVEMLQLGTGILRGVGNAGNNTLIGNSGSNYLDGGAGADRMEGGSGSDTYIVDNLGDLVIENDSLSANSETLPLGGDDVDTAIASLSYTLASLVENLVLAQDAGPSAGTGNTLDNLITGNDANNLLTGLGGNDILDGAGGTDFALYLTSPSSGHGLSVNSDGNYVITDLLASDGSTGVDTLKNIERVSFLESTLQLQTGTNLKITGDNASSTVKWTGSRSISIDGGGGDDTLQGGSGNDTLVGGDGTDTLTLPGARQLYAITSNGLGGFTISSSAEGTDSVNGIERFQFADRLSTAETLLDATPPSILQLNPADEATAVAPSANITITFSEAIVLGTGTIRLSTASGSTFASYDLPGSANLSLSGNSLVINPTGNLTDGTAFQVVIPAGSVKDLAGNSFAGTSTYNFTTATIAQTVVGTPGDDKLKGGPGNDTLNGGTGTDTAVFGGPSSEYRIRYAPASGQATISDTLTQRDGSDTLISIEKLQFDGKTFDLINPPRVGAAQYGKSQSFLFDPVYYLLKNPDLVPTVTLATAFDSYKAGTVQGAAPNAWFSASYYANRWADLKALNLDAVTLFAHYNLFGVWEGRSAGTLFDKFDGNAYLAANPDVAAYVDGNVKDFLGSRTNGAIAHYVIYGANEGRVAVDTTGATIPSDYTIEPAVLLVGVSG